MFELLPAAYLIATAVSVAVAVSALNRRGPEGAEELAVLMVAVGIYAFTSAFEVMTTGIEGKAIWMRLEYFGIATTPPLFLGFTLAYTGTRDRMLRSVEIFAWVLAILTILLVWTNSWHGLHWEGLRLDPTGQLLLYDRGPFFPVWVIGAYLVVAVGTFLLLRSAFHNRRIFQVQSALLVLATLLPWVGNLLYLTPANPFPGLDWTPIAFTLTGLLIGAAIFRFGLLALRPVARSRLIEELPDGVVVLDAGGHVVDVNPAALRLLDVRNDLPIGTPWEEVASEMPEGLRQILEEDGEGEVVRQEGGMLRTLEVDVHPFAGRRGRPGGRVVLIRDITERKQSQTEREELIVSLQEAIRQVELLEGLLPVCSRCHKIRDEEGAWEPMESYIQDRSTIEFSHSICPDCARELYPEIRLDEGDEGRSGD